METAIQRVADGFVIEAMSNLRSRTTGVAGAVIWVSAGEFAGVDIAHGPRVKVVLGERLNPDNLHDAVTIRLTDPPQVLGKLPPRIKRDAVRFVAQNREALLAHWRNEIDSIELGSALKRV